MDKYKLNKHITDALISAATKAGSYKQLADEVYLPGMLLQLITDGQFDELSKNTLEALMPKIREFLPGEEKNNVLEFICGRQQALGNRQFPLMGPATDDSLNTSEEHNG